MIGVRQRLGVSRSPERRCSERRDRSTPSSPELFGEDPDLLQLAQVVREPPEPDLDPRFPLTSAPADG